jgi:uncharacterized membrane protein
VGGWHGLHALLPVFGHIRFVLYRRFAAAVAGQDWPMGASALAQIRRWVGVNLALGVAVITVALVV